MAYIWSLQNLSTYTISIYYTIYYIDICREIVDLSGTLLRCRCRCCRWSVVVVLSICCWPRCWCCCSYHPHHPFLPPLLVTLLFVSIVASRSYTVRPARTDLIYLSSACVIANLNSNVHLTYRRRAMRDVNGRDDDDLIDLSISLLYCMAKNSLS